MRLSIVGSRSLFLLVLMAFSLCAPVARGAATLGHMRAMHFGGDWAGNVTGIGTMPADYFQYLADNHVGWLGISVAIFSDGLSDPTVRVIAAPGNSTSGGIYTFDDADLAAFIARVRQSGIHVYLTLAFEQMPGTPQDASALCHTARYPIPRWLFGATALNPASPIEGCINLPDWWWNPSHPNYAANTALFWSSYTQVAVRFARLAQQSGVEMFSLGTETESLFRTRTSQSFTNNFRSELTRMVAAVRAVYTGLLTYDQVYLALTNADFFAGNQALFRDLGLDVVGVSAYFPLVPSAPSRVLAVAELESAWESIFGQFLGPLQSTNPGVPIVFLEFGYTDDLASPAIPSSNEFAFFTPRDANGNGLDDGRDQQSNVYEAFFNVNERHDNLIRGAFLWGNGMSNYEFDLTHRGFKLQGKPAELVVRGVYQRWMDEVRHPAIEFYNSGQDHYFVSALAADIQALDSGRFAGWTRTGKTFRTWGTVMDAPPNASPVCRFYIPPAQGDSHFYSASPVECAQTQARFPSFILEAPDVMYVDLPNPVTGVCASGDVPVYRVWDNRVDSNHRYTTDPSVRAQMVAMGWIAEGYGPDQVILCAPL